MTELDQVAFHRARDAFNRKWADMSSPCPTEESEAGGGPIGYAIRAYLEAARPAQPSHEEDRQTTDMKTLYAERKNDGGAVRLQKWPEGYVLWFDGEIVWSSKRLAND